MSVIHTVLGTIPASELGIALPHEHFFASSGAANFQEPENPTDRDLARRPVTREIRDWLEYNFHCNRDNLVLDSIETAVEEAQYYRRAGGRGFIDVTPMNIGRNPQGLAAIAKQTGLHIVMGSGYYVAATLGPILEKLTPADITSQLVGEFEKGVDGTGIRSGVIGEIGCSWPLLPVEEKILRASCAAQKIIGAALYIHPGKNSEALPPIIRILESTGVDMGRVIICHIERTEQRLDRLLELLRSGIVLEYDLFGRETTGWYYRQLGIDMLSDAQRLTQIRQLSDAGFIQQLLMSHDISFKHQLHKYGGHGYDHILVNTVPWMRLRGFTQAEIDTLMVDNPRRLIELKSS